MSPTLAGSAQAAGLEHFSDGTGEIVAVGICGKCRDRTVSDDPGTDLKCAGMSIAHFTASRDESELAGAMATWSIEFRPKCGSRTYIAI